MTNNSSFDDYLDRAMEAHFWSDEDFEVECEGHESLAGEHMGETVYCDGSCIMPRPPQDDDDDAPHCSGCAAGTKCIDDILS